jgi:hypothetical protein
VRMAERSIRALARKTLACVCTPRCQSLSRMINETLGIGEGGIPARGNRAKKSEDITILGSSG